MSPNPKVSNFNLRYLYLNLSCYFLCFSLHKMNLRLVLKRLWNRFMELLVFKFLIEMESSHQLFFSCLIISCGNPLSLLSK